MLQQTNITTVKPYFHRFINRWKNIEEIAKAPLNEILKEWAGLGYYARARNLKKCAKTIINEHNGKMPNNKKELIKLQGIGDYISGAIAAIAFEENVPAVDGNVERVVSRYNAIKTKKGKLNKICKEFIQKEIDKNKKKKIAGNLAQAIMDIGATVCTPRNPKCERCPLKKECVAYKNGDMEKYPVKMKQREKPIRKGIAFVIFRKDGAVRLIKRKKESLLGEMSAVPTNDWSAKKDGEKNKDSIPFKAKWDKCGIVKHTFTHFHLELEVYQTILDEKIDKTKIPKGWWAKQKNINNEALPSLMKKTLKKAGVNVQASSR